jgi:hypothetical protein
MTLRLWAVLVCVLIVPSVGKAANARCGDVVPQSEIQKGTKEVFGQKLAAIAGRDSISYRQVLV